MNWNDLRIFLTAVRSGSYSAAGPLLGMDRTTVGRRVAALEATVGTTLFREAPTGPEPTEAGRLLLAAATRMEAEVTAAMRAAGASLGDPAPVRIAGSAGLAALLFDGLADDAHAPLAIELVAALDPIEAVTHRRADLGIAMIRATPRRLTGRQVGTVRQAPYAVRGKRPPPLGWGTEAMLALPRHWAAANDVGEASRGVRLNGWPAMVQAVRDGLGSAWLPCFLGNADSTLERIGAPDSRFDTGLWLLHRADTPQSDEATALTAALATRIAARLDAQAV
jgi:DNA-binding transcriptional LysR family regulator